MSQALVIQAARFGDILQSKRLILSLCRQHTVHLAVDRSLLPLAKLIYPQLTVHALVFHGRLNHEALLYNKGQLDILWDADFELIYNCNFSPLTAALCRIFDIQRVVGYRPATVASGGVLRSPWARLGFQLAAMRSSNPLNLVDFWAYFAADPPVSPQLVNPAALPGGRGLGIAVAGRDERRSVPIDALAAIARILFNLLGNPPIKLLGTAAENARAKNLVRNFNSAMLQNTTNLCGKTTWQQLMEEMSGLDCLISPDTGLMHLAAHLGVPVLACFLASASCHETGPYGQGHKILQTAPTCAPCLESTVCKFQLQCHSPWHQANLGRSVAQAWTNTCSPDWPNDLQLWQPAFDNMGIYYDLKAGEAAALTKRQILRNIVKNKLNLEPIWEAHLPERQRLLRQIDGLPDFALPPERYC